MKPYRQKPAPVLPRGLGYARGVNRYRDETGLWHVMNGARPLCGARPFTWSYQGYEPPSESWVCRTCLKVSRRYQ